MSTFLLWGSARRRRRLGWLLCSVGFSLVLFLTPRPAAAGKACAESFSESGDWGTGKSFKVSLELEGVGREQAFVTVAQRIATEGFLGLSASKDVGVVSAYQETNGKRSAINAMVSEPTAGKVRIEAVFQLAPGLRSPAGAVRDALCKIVESAVPSEQRAGMAKAAADVTLRRDEGDVAIDWKGGVQRQAGGGIVLLIYVDYPGVLAEARTKSSRPTLLVHSDSEPTKRFILVRLDVDSGDNRRSVKLGSAGQLLRAGMSGKGELRPDDDWTVALEVSSDSPGFWRVSPKKDLPKGEYGIWDLEGYALADFGVDR